MAITKTTLASAVSVNDNSIVVTSATGFTPNCLVQIDQETLQVVQSYLAGGTTIPVLRGRDGSVTAAHKSGANASAFLPSDEPGPTAQTYTTFPTVRGITLTSYSAAGAITLPAPGSDAIAIINGTGALAMTLASPTQDMDGSRLTIVSNGKAAHTVTYTAGFGANTTSSDVVTFHATETQAVQAIACNGVWVLIGHVAGAATVAGAGLA